jgi:hypothetical protein
VHGVLSGSIKLGDQLKEGNVARLGGSPGGLVTLRFAGGK